MPYACRMPGDGNLRLAILRYAMPVQVLLAAVFRVEAIPSQYTVAAWNSRRLSICAPYGPPMMEALQASVHH